MPTETYGVYHQGAMFSKEDFDPAKIIFAFAEERELDLSPKEQDLIKTNNINPYLVHKLCDEFKVSLSDVCQVTDYSLFSNEFITDVMEWIKEDESFLSADGVSAYCVSDFESEFLFADKNRSREMVINCFILAFNVPPIWAREGVRMPDTMNEAAEMLREAGKKLLKDDIDWESRLGELIGSNFG